jgi:hypothetical protein
MSRYEYLWQDGGAYKKPTKLAAPDYVNRLMDWIEVRINDETIFPSDSGSLYIIIALFGHFSCSISQRLSTNMQKDINTTVSCICTRLHTSFRSSYSTWSGR